MIPSRATISALWDEYHLPQEKRIHCQLVCDVAQLFVQAYQRRGFTVHATAVSAAALLHDIDKCMEKNPEDRHPDAAVRMLRTSGMGEIADIVKTHPLHAILDPAICPKTIEQTIVFLSDKMVKYTVVGIEERFRLWHQEAMTPKEQEVLIQAYPLVCALQKKLEIQCGIGENEVQLAFSKQKES